MKICIIANGFPDKRNPQWGCFERDQAVALKNAGHDVYILYVDKRFLAYWRKIGYSYLSENGVKVYGLFLFPTQWIRWCFGSKIHYWLVTRMYDLVYKKCIKECSRPDVIYAHYLYNIAYAVFLKRKYCIPLVGIEHWSVLNQKSLTSFQRKQGRLAYDNVDKLLAVSQSLRNQIYKHFGVDSTVVYDMLGLEFITPIVLKRKKNDGLRYIAVGSLHPIKGYDVLINAFAKSGLNKQGCLLSIVGNGTERPLLEKLVKNLKLDNSVVLHGHKTKQEIIQLLSESHVFVLSSKAETFGVACIEALSQGLPAIATKCGGPEEIIDKTNGIFVETGDEDALAEAMKEMYANYNSYDSKAIADNCRNRFAPQVIATQLVKIFNEIMN